MNNEDIMTDTAIKLCNQIGFGNISKRDIFRNDIGKSTNAIFIEKNNNVAYIMPVSNNEYLIQISMLTTPGIHDYIQALRNAIDKYMDHNNSNERIIFRCPYKPNMLFAKDQNEIEYVLLNDPNNNGDISEIKLEFGNQHLYKMDD